MVNTGKPSTGCGRCRTRRIKCDEGRPECSRCLKYKKPCPGYRDRFDDKLRYKPRTPRKKLTEDIVQSPLVPRSRTSSQSSGAGYPKSRASSSYEHSLVFSRRASSPESVIHTPLMDPIDQQAECFFIANFVKIAEAGPGKGYLDFVIPLLTAPQASRCLPLAFSAVSQAALATYQHSPISLSKTRMQYLQALSRINLALRDPAQALDDSVVASVLLLAKFEQITPSEMALRGWKSHIDGALTLLKARPAGRRRSPHESDLMAAVREQMIPLSIARGLPLDSEFAWIESEIDDREKCFSQLNVDMSQLQADNKVATKLAERSIENIERVINLLQRAKHLDQQYADWVAALPSSWVVQTSDWSEFEPSDVATSLVHPGRVYTFGDLWMANKYNVARSCRILIWSTILRCMAWLNGPYDYMTTDEYLEGSRKCRNLIEDVTSSIPYYFGWTPKTSPATANLFEHSVEIQASMKGRASIFLLWPLYVAASSDFASPSERKYLRGKMKYIANNLGVNQAVIVLKDDIKHPSHSILREGKTFDICPASRPPEGRIWWEENVHSTLKPRLFSSSTEQVSLA
ncbi:hypothetical protein ONS95_011053 [Cadophora gregata]|uniref:uncharacterized protein n=1 Tax=Cadophora gregata TaxID=51156 RepID=UPI0026DD8AD8|nr:uncharacterized protein ONS95_011053 [Cadophora gregata]KAK0119613.1 hypothetical protein ONS95_011053 [Cadophora gregata]KAK0120648.1 hypothetical protein ONS96_010852 [Cadophora gregata f. sp. sojae]